jgi:hypothetical protein
MFVRLMESAGGKVRDVWINTEHVASVTQDEDDAERCIVTLCAGQYPCLTLVGSAESVVDALCGDDLSEVSG